MQKPPKSTLHHLFYKYYPNSLMLSFIISPSLVLPQNFLKHGLHLNMDLIEFHIIIGYPNSTTSL